ncbi:MAG: hypothetical protein AAFQ22_00845 [Pseudomonadota bacterium]
MALIRKPRSLALLAMSSVSALALTPHANATTNETITGVTFNGAGGACSISPTVSLGANADDDATTAGIQDSFRVVLSSNTTLGAAPGPSQLFQTTANQVATGAFQQTLNFIVPSNQNLGSTIAVNVLDTTSATASTGRAKAVRTLTLSQINAAGGACATLAASSGFGANQAPVADAGTDILLNNYTPGAPIQLDGSGSSDPDGDPLSYSWFNPTGLSGIIFSDPNAVSPTLSVPPAFFGNQTTAQFIVNLEVRDGNGGVSNDSILVTLNRAAVNQAPVANAGNNISNPSYVSGTPITLDGSASSDPDGDPLTYSWRQISGPTGGVSLTNTSSPQATFSVTGISAARQYGFELTVSDGQASSTSTVVVNVAPAPVNQAPVANAGIDRSINGVVGGDTLQLNGNSSQDPDGDPLTVSWTQTGGPSGITFDDPTDISPEITFPSGLTGAQTFTLTLTVSDPSGAQSTDTVDIIANYAAPAQLLTAGPSNLTYASVSGECRVSADLSVTGVTDDGNGRDEYEVRLTPAGTPNNRIDFGQSSSVPVGQSQNERLYARIRTNTVSLSGLSGSGDDLDFAVFDLAGSQRTQVGTARVDKSAMAAAGGACSDVVALIDGVNRSPTVDAGADATLTGFTASSQFSLTGSAADADGDALTFAWTQVSGPAVTISDATTLTPQISYDPGQDPAQQQVVLRLSADDGTNPPVADDITLTLMPNNAPVADAGSDQTFANLATGGVVQLDASNSSDVNNDSLTYVWTQTAGPTVSLSDAANVAPSFTVPAGLSGQQTLTFDVTVTDGVSSSSDTVAVTFTVNDPPTADAGADQTINAPGQSRTVTLDGSASSDPDGDTLSYMWSQTSGRSVTLNDPAAQSPTFIYTLPTGTPPTRETFVFSLVVDDGVQTSPADQISVVFVNNTAPVADAGTALSGIDAGDLVTLDATASTDPDGDVLSYSWRQVSGPVVSLQNASSARPSFVAPNVSNTASIVFEVEVSDGDLTDTARVSVEVRPTGSITIVQVAQGGDQVFGFTSSLAALATTIGTTNGSGQLVATNVVTGTYTVTADDLRASGFALTGLSCSDDDSQVDVSTRTATIALAPGEDVTCTFTSVNSRGAAQQEIREFLTTRNSLLLSNGPDLQRRMDRLNGTVQRGALSAGGYLLPGSDQQPVTAELDVDGGRVATSLKTFQSGKSDSVNTGEGSFDVWVEGTFATFDIAGRSGDFSLFYGGVDYLLSEDVLIGGLVQLDQIDQDGDRTGGGAASGDGFMVGPYLTARLLDNLYLDARAAFGQSDNTVSPLGTYEDGFDTDRTLLEASLFGDWKLEEDTIVRPTVSFRHISESQNAYTDSLGVDIPGQTVDQGELSFAPRIQTLWAPGGTVTLRPYAEIEGILSFGDEPEALLGRETRLRLEAGSDLFGDENLRGSLAVFADGVGADQHQAQGLRFQFTYAFD